MWALCKALHIGGRKGQSAMNPMLDLLTSYLTDTVSTAGVLSQEIGIYKNKEGNLTRANMFNANPTLHPLYLAIGAISGRALFRG